MAYFFFAGSPRRMLTATTVYLVSANIRVAPVEPIVTVGTVLKLPTVTAEIIPVMPLIEFGTELELPMLDVSVTPSLPEVVFLDINRNAYWYFYNVLREGE